jgi:nicotinamide-nucleotide amidase
MAEGAAALTGADFAIAVSGIAGPDGGSDAKPVGTVWFGFFAGGRTVAEQAYFAGDRDAVRRAAARYALNGLLERASPA